MGVWRHCVLPCRPQIAIRFMRIACCIRKATNTHTACVTFIAFPLQQWLQKHVSILRLRTLPVLSTIT